MRPSWQSTQKLLFGIFAFLLKIAILRYDQHGNGTGVPWAFCDLVDDSSEYHN